MMKKEIVLLTVLVLFLLSFIGGTGFAQGAASNEDLQKFTLQGKIEFMERLGGYYFMGENPPSEYFIVNQDKKVLEKLKKRGKTVTIEGHYTIGADHLMIEKINGKKYSGKASR